MQGQLDVKGCTTCVHHVITQIFKLTWFCCCVKSLKRLVLQIEEAYIGADQFCSLVRQDSQSVLRNELNVLHGLKFDLITHPPLRAMQGFFQARIRDPCNMFASNNQSCVDSMHQSRRCCMAAVCVMVCCTS